MSGLQHKMYNYEVTPPAGVWDKIASELDESELEHQFPSKLYQYEVAPPIAAWKNIATTLDAEKEAPVPEHRRFSPIWKYAAAAAIIAFLAWGGLKLINTKKESTEIANKEETLKPTENVPVNTETTLPSVSQDAVVTIPDKSTTEQDAIDNAALEASKKTYAKADLPASTKLKGVSDFYFAVSTPRRIGDFSMPEPEENNIADRYIMLMTPDGNIIRMSKKLGSLVCCVSGEDQDLNCIDQMKKWREKLANSSVGHSSGNFMDILNLLSTLQGNDEQ